MLSIIIVLIGCGSKYSLHEDFKADLDQILNIIDSAREDKRKLEDEEYDLISMFQEKYEVGQFIDSDEKTYEMNDLEKAITHEIPTLKLFIDSEETLASEKGMFDKSRESIDEYLETKEIPEDLVGKYPTYEMYSGIHPQIKADAKKIVDEFDIVVNGPETDIDSTQMNLLYTFKNDYGKVEFKLDDKSYLVNNDSFFVVYMIEELIKDFEEGSLTSLTVDNFNRVKDLINE